MSASPSALARRLLYCSAGFALAVLLAVIAAHYYEPPNLFGSSRRSLWLEPDTACSLGSGSLALLVAWFAGRGGDLARPGVFGRLLVHALLWFGLTLFLFAFWSQFVLLLTLLIAPTHGFAALRLGLLWQAWRAEVAWRSM